MTVPPIRVNLQRCANPVHHQPPYAYVDHHHMLPHSWGGPTEADNLLPLCQSCHHAIHWLLDEFVKRGEAFHDRHLSRFVNEMARYAWDRRPEHPTPTLVHEWSHGADQADA